MSDGFLSRWSRRKLDVTEGRQAEAQVAPAAAPRPSPAPSPASGAGSPEDDSGELQPLPPPPTLEEAQALTPASDFSRFAMRDVAPEVRNTALKKLFADPRYNVMDGMDVYVGDYTQADPIPESMLRSLASAKFLGLFKEEDEKPQQDVAGAEAATPPPVTRDVADDPAGQSVAQSIDTPTAPPEPPPHADADLRLQPNHAPAGQDPGEGAG